MTRKESELLKEMFRERSKDFWSPMDGEFDPNEWRRYLKKIKTRIIEDDQVCEEYNNKEDTVLVDNPHMGAVWMVMPKDLALKSLLLGQLPPKYSKKPTTKG